MTRNRDSAPHVQYGGTVTLRVDLVIVVCLLFFFILIAVHSFDILRPAFQAAYTNDSPDSLLNTSSLLEGLDQSSTFHREYFSPQVTRWEGSILEWSIQYSLPPDLIAIVMQIESCGDPRAQSSAGAIGIFQVMPFHFNSQENPFDVTVNAERGLDYLARGYASSNEDIALTLAGYNGGHSTINESAELWPQETKRYVIWGEGIWEDIQAGRHPSPTLDRWLAAGGARLCSAASASTVSYSSSN